MRLIAITYPDFQVPIREEADAITTLLLRRKFDRVHIRKPSAAEAEVRELIEAIDSSLRDRLTLNDCFSLAEPLGIGGVNLNGRNPDPPEGWHGLISRSCHSLKELHEALDGRRGADYAFLSPVFDSRSKPGYRSAFIPEQLRGNLPKGTIALGGVGFSDLDFLKELGFDGAAMVAAAWEGLLERQP